MFILLLFASTFHVVIITCCLCLLLIVCVLLLAAEGEDALLAQAIGQGPGRRGGGAGHMQIYPLLFVVFGLGALG